MGCLHAFKEPMKMNMASMKSNIGGLYFLVIFKIGLHVIWAEVQNKVMPLSFMEVLHVYFYSRDMWLEMELTKECMILWCKFFC